MASAATPPCPEGLEQDAWEQALLMAPELAQLNWEKPKKDDSDDFYGQLDAGAAELFALERDALAELRKGPSPVPSESDEQ